MIHIEYEKDCTGCGACVEICSRKCIELKPTGVLGTLIPMVEECKCIDCGACDRVCPKKNEVSRNYEQRAYAAYTKDNDVRWKSSSGGMFLTFARYLISKGYFVYGASFNDHLKLECTFARTEHDLDRLAKSKYLQSNLNNKYSEIKYRLDQGERVLFVSTPCQVSALKLFLKKYYEKLVTVDFFCHGVPSQVLFDECKEYEDKKFNRKTLDYMFRAKVKNGVTPHYFSLTYKKNGKLKKKTDFYYNSLFYALFQQYIILRESCYDCQFASKERASDLTIGDFHEIDKYLKGINRFEGVSTVIINSRKGQDLFNSVSEQLTIHNFDIDKLIEDRIIFSGGTKKPSKREQLVKDYYENGIDFVAKKYAPKKSYLKQKIYYRMPKLFKGFAKRIFRIN